MTTNITITVPIGTSNHGDPDIICLPSKWTDILLFYAVNYLAHALTVKSYPGEKLQDTAYYIVMALLYPYSGLLRGMEAIDRRAAWCRGNGLQRAARAGALCVVVRDADWKPLDGQVVTDCQIRPREVADDTQQMAGVTTESSDTIQSTSASWLTLIPKQFCEGIFRNPVIGTERTIHGNRFLPPGYTIAFLPSNVEFKTIPEAALSMDVSISSSYNFVKAIVAIVQVVLASTTLYKTRGDQIERYGYAAFGLMVLPYVIMSTVNLLGNLLTPDYPTLYLVRSPEMIEAEDPRRNGWFDGFIGEVKHTPREHFISILFKEVEGGFELHTVDNHGSVGLAEHDLSLTVDGTPLTESDNQQVPTSSTIEQRRLILERLFIISEDTARPRYKYVRSRTARAAHRRAYANNLLSTSIDLNIPAASNFVYSKAQAWEQARSSIWMLIAAAMVLVPLIVVGILTRFKGGSSTSSQKVWIMGWLLFGTVGGVFFAKTAMNAQLDGDDFMTEVADYMKNILTDGRALRKQPWVQRLPSWVLKYIDTPKPGYLFISWVKSKVSKPDKLMATVERYIVRLTRMTVYAVFAFGGLVVVGQMLKEYGTCSKLS